MSEGAAHPRIVEVGPDGSPVGAGPGPGPVPVAGVGGEDAATEAASLATMVEQPAKVMRIGTMVKQLLEEVRAAPLDEASRARLREIYESSIRELGDGLAPELRDELTRLSLPLSEESVPSEAELRVAQAQLVGWLEGLFHGLQTALFAQQMAARAQLEDLRRRALPGGPPMAANGPDGGRASGPYL